MIDTIDTIFMYMLLWLVVWGLCALGAAIVAATSPSGERLSTMQFDWHGDDNPDAPIKYRVFAQQLPVVIGSEGSYTLALCEDPDAADDAAAVFPLQISRNPMAPLAEDARYGSLPG